MENEKSRIRIGDLDKVEYECGCFVIVEANKRYHPYGWYSGPNRCHKHSDGSGPVESKKHFDARQEEYTKYKEVTPYLDKHGKMVK